MPIYEYRCSHCGHIFDAFQRIGANGDDLACPVCAAPKPEKILSSFASCGSSSMAASSGCGGGGFT